MLSGTDRRTFVAPIGRCSALFDMPFGAGKVVHGAIGRFQGLVDIACLMCRAEEHVVLRMQVDAVAQCRRAEGVGEREIGIVVEPHHRHLRRAGLVQLEAVTSGNLVEPITKTGSHGGDVLDSIGLAQDIPAGQ